MGLFWLLEQCYTLHQSVQTQHAIEAICQEFSGTKALFLKSGQSYSVKFFFYVPDCLESAALRFLLFSKKVILLD